MSNSDGASAANSAGNRTSRSKRDARSIEAQLKDALRLFAKNGRLTKAQRLAALEAPSAKSAGPKRSSARKAAGKEAEFMTPFMRTVASVLARTGKMTKKERLAAVRAGYGAWKDRPEWKGMTSIQIAAELRRRSLSNRGRDG